MINITEVKRKLDTFFAIADDSMQDELLVLDTIASSSGNLLSNYYLRKLRSSEWPLSADPAFICNQDLEEDKECRASAIYSLMLSEHLDKNKKFLDFGCGEGYLVRHTQNLALSIGYDITEQNW